MCGGICFFSSSVSSIVLIARYFIRIGVKKSRDGIWPRQ
jgi:hypothetical protein